MKLEALKHQGKKMDETSRPVVGKSESAEIVGKESGDSGRQIQRYIRLTELDSPILDMVDEGRIAFRPAVELSYLKPAEQKRLLEVMESEECTPSLTQSTKLKQFSKEGKLTNNVILSIMKEVKPNQKETIKIQKEKISKYFRKGTTDKKLKIPSSKRWSCIRNARSRWSGNRIQGGRNAVHLRSKEERNVRNKLDVQRLSDHPGH